MVSLLAPGLVTNVSKFYFRLGLPGSAHIYPKHHGNAFFSANEPPNQGNLSATTERITSSSNFRTTVVLKIIQLSSDTKIYLRQFTFLGPQKKISPAPTEPVKCRDITFPVPFLSAAIGQRPRNYLSCSSSCCSSCSPFDSFHSNLGPRPTELRRHRC